MRLHIHFLVAFFFLVSVGTQSGVAQDVDYHIYRLYAPLALTPDIIQTAQTIEELNPHFKTMWVKKYKEVSIASYQDGKLVQSSGPDQILTSMQRSQLLSVDFGSEIKVKVTYLPDNTLKHNDDKVYDFSFVIEPSQSSAFVGGDKAMLGYIKHSLIDRLTPNVFDGEKLAAVKFTIDEEGHIISPQIVESTGDPNTDEAMLRSLCEMPKWQPAAYSDGSKTSQQYMLTVGNLQSCLMNVHQISRI